MKKFIAILIVVVGTCAFSCQEDDMDHQADTKPKQVVKTNPTKMYMHMMPWFQSKEVSGYWGSHWRMSNKNPETILPNGQREIASHYYPLTGPYDSSDPDLVDYQLLLMKYAGIDGLLIDWYGSHTVLDYGANLKNTNAIVEGAKRVGLQFAMVYEDNTAYEVERRKDFTAVEAAQMDMTYAKEHYFSSTDYIRIDNKPLWMTFGPRYFLQEAQWTEILSVLDEKPTFFSLWNLRHRLGPANASGEFAWVDFNPSFKDLDHFYNTTNVGLQMGSAYPCFHDFYQQGGWGDSYGYVDAQQGAMLQKTLDKAADYHSPYIQLVTWNDYGEGTMIEPTVEFQYQFVETLQSYTGVTYTKRELETIYTYYIKRKEYKGNAEVQLTLNHVFDALNQLDVPTAQELLNNL